MYTSDAMNWSNRIGSISSLEWIRRLREERWFGGKTRDPVHAEVFDWAEVPPRMSDAALGVLLIVEVTYSDDSHERYFVPLACGAAEGAHVAAADLSDLLATPRVAAELLATFDNAPSVARRGRFNARSFDEKALDAEALGTPEALNVDQSNTHLRCGDRFVLKCLRRLHAGTHPDIEIPRRLAASGFRHTPRLRGVLQHEADDGLNTALALLFDFVPNRGSAWDILCESLRTSFSEPTTSDDVPPPSLELARQLGECTGELHVALAACDGPDFEPEVFSPDSQHALVASAQSCVERLCSRLQRSVDGLSDDVQAQLDEVKREGPAWQSRCAQLLAAPLRSQRIRTHGDYHLGQVLMGIDAEVHIIDFEGEPARPLAERRTKSSPLRDVAGMLRSFHYAVEMSADEAELTRHDSRPTAAVEQLRQAFLAAYRPKIAASLPCDAEEFALLLRLHLIDKAFYEIHYELDHRPAAVRIPLRGLEGLLA